MKVEGVSVVYRVPHERIPSIKEYAIHRLRRRIRYVDHWALKSVDLEVGRGEILGVIGANGAGKSTLLKVVARVLRPTEGRVRVWGRVAPLLELGAGFDMELTGRENVFLAGATLGFTKSDIARRFDGIVAFAELGEFIDAPMRTYSSGMKARLGFAVASDVKPEVLIVDEVLAVGDAAFKAKCHARIQGFLGAGTATILVSHDATTLEKLCDRLLLLDHGAIVAHGKPGEVLDRYQQASR